MVVYNAGFRGSVRCRDPIFNIRDHGACGEAIHMTPNSPLTAEQMLEIARRVYPALVDVNKNEILVFQNHEWSIFNPSLTGTPEQRLQALDVLKALAKIYVPYGRIGNALMDSLSTDDLTPAMLAILESTP